MGNKRILIMGSILTTAKRESGSEIYSYFVLSDEDSVAWSFSLKLAPKVPPFCCIPDLPRWFWSVEMDSRDRWSVFLEMAIHGSPISIKIDVTDPLALCETMSAFESNPFIACYPGSYWMNLRSCFVQITIDLKNSSNWLAARSIGAKHMVLLYGFIIIFWRTHLYLSKSENLWIDTSHLSLGRMLFTFSDSFTWRPSPHGFSKLQSLQVISLKRISHVKIHTFSPPTIYFWSWLVSVI